MSGEFSFSWEQSLILCAASMVDHIGYGGSNIPHGVFKGLVIRGFLAPHPRGYEITPEGIVAAHKQRGRQWTGSGPTSASSGSKNSAPKDYPPRRLPTSFGVSTPSSSPATPSSEKSIG